MIHKLLYSAMALFVPFAADLSAENRNSSAPYLTGDTFRSYADHIFDETGITSHPCDIVKGDVIFLKTDYLEWFIANYHPHILAPYILITHNSDIGVPGDFDFFLDDPKLMAWFAINVDGTLHPKLHPLPIGLANSYWEHGNPDTFDLVREHRSEIDKEQLLYMNFNPTTHLIERTRVYDMFVNKPYCTVSSWDKMLLQYLVELASSQFALSPRGNGLDCHRTWEALYMGTVPIVKSSPLDPLFTELPVLVINDWSEINREMLEETHREFAKKSANNEWNIDKLFINYWMDYIHSFRGD